MSTFRRIPRAIAAWAVFVAMAACSPSADPAGPATTSTDGLDGHASAPSPSNAPGGDGTSPAENRSGFYPGKPRRGRMIVAMTKSGCRLHAINGPIPARHLRFVAWNVTDDTVAFDIGMLADGHTFDELVSHIRNAWLIGHRGGPVAQRPRYFRGSIRGDTTFLHGGAPGPSLLRLNKPISGRMTWAYHPGAFRYRGQRLDPRGTWAVICYRSSGSAGLEPAGLLGPLKVGTRSR